MILLLSMVMAHANMFKPEPLNRLSVGPSYSDGSYGVAASFDSRLTQLIYFNIGIFRSLDETNFNVDDTDLQSRISLRHGVWSAVGIRYPHRYSKKENAINWDLIFRGGFGCFFSDLADKDDWLMMELGGLGGADFILRRNDQGLKFSAKGIFYSPYLSDSREKIDVFRPIGTVAYFKDF